MPSPSTKSRSAAGTLARVFVVYLAVAVLVWWHVWSTHPTSASACACGDPGLVTWFLNWPAYALSHGLSPFYSSLMFHPIGINLLSNASSLAFGIPLAPVTWLFGPTATLNVSLTLAPALSALSMFWLLRRWVHWTPAAFVGGLVYGFSPFMIENLAIGHLMTAALVVPPLVVACFDELLVRQRRRPVRVGIVLGALVVVQFFSGTELVAIMAISGVAGLVIVVGYGLAHEGRAVFGRARHAVTGFASAIVVSGACLAYPAWFALAGRAHLAGQVWGKLSPAGEGGIRVGNLFDTWHVGTHASNVNGVSGYTGAPLPSETYMGLGMLIVAVVGILVWRRDRRLWFFSAFALANIVLSLGTDSQQPWVPWNVLARVPVIRNIIPGRVMAMTLLCAAAILAIVVDRSRVAIETRLAPRLKVPRARTAVVATVGALTIAVIGMAPMAAAETSVLPLAAPDLRTPAWFTHEATRLPRGAVVLTFGSGTAGPGKTLVWQAVGGMHFALVGGDGPEKIPARAGRERPGYEVLQNDAFPFAKLVDPSAADRRSVRQALEGWGVTDIVIPESLAFLGLPSWPDDNLVGVLTEAVGRPPRLVDHVVVWSDVQARTPELTVSSSSYEACLPRHATGVDPLVAEGECLATGGH